METDPLLEPAYSNQADASSSVRHATPRKQYRILIVEPMIILFWLGWTPTVTLMQQYAHARFQDELNITSSLHVSNNESLCDVNKTSHVYQLEQQAQALSSKWLLNYDLVCSLPCFLTIFFLGAYSDKRGRKTVLILATFGELCREASVFVTILFDLPLDVAYSGALLQACFGGPAAFLMVIFAYLSDITTHEQRSFRVVILVVCLGLGAVTSELALGPAIQRFGYMWPLVPCMSFQVINILYTLLFVPETIEPDPDSKVCSTEYLKATFLLYFKDNGTGRRWKLQLCVLILVFIGMAELGRSDVTTLFAMDSPLCWNSSMLGNYLGASFGIMNFGSIVFSKIFQKVLGDPGLMILGSVSGAAYAFYFTFVKSTLMAFCAPLLGIACLLTIAMVRSYCSKLVTSSEEGAMFAGIAWLENLSAILGVLLFNNVYSATVSTLFPGFVFITIAACYVVDSFFVILLIVWLKTESISLNNAQSLFSSLPVNS